MFRRCLLPALALLASATHGAQAQVYRDLEAVDLVYRIELAGEEAPVGTMTISFTPQKTERGSELTIHAQRDYVLPATTPYEYHEETKLFCDADGLKRFSSSLLSGTKDVRHTGLLTGEDFHVSSKYGERQEEKTITSGVRRTPLGIFCAGYLATPFHEGPMMVNWPWLVPPLADHEPRQKYREAIMPTDIGGGDVLSTISTLLKRQNGQTDRLLNVNNELQILLRMQEETPFGLLVHEIESVNGVPFTESDLVR